MAGGTGGKDGWGREVQHCASFFYADDILVALTDLVWLQGVFDTLTGLLDRVGLQTNSGNMVGMLCFPCCAMGLQSEAAY